MLVTALACADSGSGSSPSIDKVHVSYQTGYRLDQVSSAQHNFFKYSFLEILRIGKATRKGAGYTASL